MSIPARTKTQNGTLNKYSSILTQTRSQVGSQAMLYGVGLTDEDMKRRRWALPAWAGKATPATCT
jgi:dihydroxy-acid dehydratase